MARYSPQTNYFEKSQRFSKVYNISYWTVFALSIVVTVFRINGIIDYLGVISIVFLAILEGISQDFKLRAEKVRRRDFIDNSFGTKLVHDSSDEYYDNDEIDYGMKKTVANLFENSFFSFNVSKAMYIRCLPMNLIFLAGIILLSVLVLAGINLQYPFFNCFFQGIFCSI